MGFRSWVALVGFTLLMAGCTGSPDDGDGVGGTDALEGEGDPGGAEGVGQGSQVAVAPVLEVGDSWSYVAEGYWSEVQELTVVVAEHDEQETLFAASEFPQLLDEVAWDLPYLGWTDGDMRPLWDTYYGGEPHSARLLDFPLEPGKGWDYWNTRVTAQPVNLTVLGDEMPGWRIAGEDDARRVVVEYAPQIGYITFYEEYNKGSDRVYWSLELTGTGSGSDWVWFERAHEVIAGSFVDPGASPAPVSPPEVLEVAEGDDLVLFWGLATEGSHGSVVPPPGGPVPWTFEGEGAADVKTASFDAEPGGWTVSGVAGDPEGWVYIQGHSLRLLGGT